MSLNFRQGLWRLADPKVTLASMSSMFLGACAAAAEGPLAWGCLALTVFGIFLIEVAKNASGEIVDFDSGTDLWVAPEDRSPFSGGKRVLVDGLLTRRQTVAIAAVCYVAGASVGMWIVWTRAPGVFFLGTLGVALAFFYHAPPLKLSYRGLGEAAVGLCYGPLIGVGTYLVQRMTVPVQTWILFVPLGMLIAAFLWINEFPDFLADRKAGKKTWVVRLGRPRAARVFVVILLMAEMGQLLLPIFGLPHGVWWGLVSLPPAAAAGRLAVAHPEEPKRLILAQALTLVSFLMMSLGAGIGLLAG